MSVGTARVAALKGAPWLLLVLASAGCSRVGQVSGKASYRGRPLPAGTVMLLASDGQPYDGPIQTDGTFVIRDVPIGTAKVSVTSIVPAGEEKRTRGGKEASQAKQRTIAKGGRSRIPSKYSDFEKSGLTVTVEKGDKNRLDLDLQ